VLSRLGAGDGLVTDRTACNAAAATTARPPGDRRKVSPGLASPRPTLEDMANGYGSPVRRRSSAVRRAAHGGHHTSHHRSVTHRASVHVGHNGVPHHTVKHTAHASIAHHHGRKGHTTVHTISHHRSVKHHAHPGSSSGLPWGHSGDMGITLGHGHSGGRRRAVGARRRRSSGRMPAMAMSMPSGFGGGF
jgi:hypothetical protein